MRVLSRRSNLRKAVACGYSEGAGFVVLTEPPPLGPLPLCALWATTRRRGVGELCRRAPRVSCALGWLCTLARATSHWQPPSAEATPRRRRGGGDSSRRHRQGGVPVCLALGGAATPELAVPGPSAEAEKSARRRRRAATTPLDGVGEHSPAPATAAAALWFQSQGQRQWALLADNETAQALQHGCGDDCSRSASLAALHARPLALH